MRWMGRRESENVEDRRGMGPQIAVGGVGTLILAVVIMLFGGDPTVIFGNSDGSAPGVTAPTKGSPQEEERKHFVSVVLADTEDVWHSVFEKSGRSYQEPRLVLYRGSTETGCGFGSAATGPFYCGEDERVYIDLSFLDELDQRFGAPGDFAQAYVVAHEVGHHVQKQLGILDRVHAQQERVGKTEANRLSVDLELQADFFAGVWAHHTQKMRNTLDASDIPEALRAAASIGDDRLQERARGYVVPETFTHGTSEQRVRWFKRGWESGDIRQGNTFEASRL